MRGNHPLDLSDGTKETSKALGRRTHFTGDAPTTEFERHRQARASYYPGELTL